jgi:dTDP-4-dehydrorhamnose reductase
MKNVNTSFNSIVIGSDGFIGKNLINFFSTSKLMYIATSKRKTNRDFYYLNLEKPNLNFLSLVKERFEYAFIVSGTGVKKCEEEKEYSYLINVKNTIKLVNELLHKNITPILFSSGYVFDGKKDSYDENSILNPINEYGRQKAILEQIMEREFKGKYLMIRSSKVFGVKKNDNTILDEMMNSVINKKPIIASIDQIFNPIFVEDMINYIISLINLQSRGLYIIAGKERINRYVLACLLIKKCGLKEENVKKTFLDEISFIYKCPRRIILNSSKLLNVVDLPITPLEKCIYTIIRNYEKELNQLKFS